MLRHLLNDARLTQGGFGTGPLVRARARRSAARHLPPEAARRTMVRDRLAALSLGDPGPGDGPPGLRAPPGTDQTVGAIFSGILQRWGRSGPATLTAEESSDLALLERLLTAPTAEAGGLATLFAQPDAVLGLREKVTQATLRRAVFDAEIAAFDAARRAFERQASALPADLDAALAAHGAADVHLWHRIVAEHDPSDPAQARAAARSAGDPRAAPATVALYVSRAVREGPLATASLAGDDAALRRISVIFDSWAEAPERNACIGLSPPDAVATNGPEVAAGLDRAADLLGRPRLPVPQGLFTHYPEAPARPRPEWDLATGRMRLAPDPADYIDAASLTLA
ncbi:hypothetical protein SAMN05444413_102358 [Roseivivax marinus]|uniref:hypothetical protein n=1 Tax=Roseivivax marinus TaxID=1379903 RepID=UPI0008C22AB8|nr:hypothetical protein [Roseivivax marinus]SEK61697.1 hypothetical protein SAMN05444413_102358 [Roseivivax marinus]